ncbi:hypothetical protein [Halomonas sp. BMC7]|uniref:hypothetical protein n=1 Tax=Halomonas sp. BMC7 TaxID=2920520 RepID=UPI001582BC2D|nr:hypothetical protein [Halomonas sp. BMC7]NUJ60130.1 hypothetical protein [Halomonas taeanensis]
MYPEVDQVSQVLLVTPMGKLWITTSLDASTRFTSAPAPALPSRLIKQPAASLSADDP